MAGLKKSRPRAHRKPAGLGVRGTRKPQWPSPLVLFYGTLFLLSQYFLSGLLPDSYKVPIMSLSWILALFAFFFRGKLKTLFMGEDRKNSFFPLAWKLNHAVQEKGPIPIWDRAALIAAAGFLLYISVLLRHPLTHPQELIGVQDIDFNFPFRYFWVQSLKSGDPAFWEPYAALGNPFPETLNVGAFSPFNLIYLILPVAYGMTWLSFIHFFIAAFGTYLFIKALGGGSWGSFLGGMSFAFSSYFLSHTEAGGINMVWASAWFPLALYFLKRCTENFKITNLAAAGTIMGLQVLEGHPQITFYSYMIAAFFFLAYWIGKKISFRQFLLGGAGTVLLSLVLSAAQWLPSFLFISRSNRWDWGYSKIMTDFTNPRNLTYFIKPFYLGSPLMASYFPENNGGYHEMATYIGLIPLFLALAGLVWAGRRPLIRWFWVLAVLFTLLAMGDSTVLSHWIYNFFYAVLPGFGRSRSVGRIMLLTLFCLSCAAGLSLEEFSGSWRRWTGGILKRSNGPKRMLALLLPAVLTAGAVLDLWLYDKDFIRGMKQDVFFSGAPKCPGDVTSEALRDKELPRIQGDKYFEWEMIPRVSQPLSRFADTVLIRETADYLTALQSNWDSPLSDLIDLKYLFDKDLANHPTNRWKPYREETVVNLQAAPRAFVAGGYEWVPSAPDAIGRISKNTFDLREQVLLEKEPEEKLSWEKGRAGEAEITRYGNGSLELSCKNTRPGFLFLSDSYYPGWRAWVDGVEKPILRADGAFRAVVLDKAGEHRVRMEYHPTLAYFSLGFTLIGWVLLIGWAAFRVSNRSTNPPGRRPGQSRL